MDHSRFDALTRTLSSRRTALAGVFGGVAILLGIAPEAAAHNPTPACRRLRDPAKRRACRRRARVHNRTHRCRPRPPATICAALGRCSGVAANNCGRLVNCTCPLGLSCLSNGTCAESCQGDGQAGCRTGCRCLGPEVGNGFHCIPLRVLCSQVPQVCASTADCPPGSFCAADTCPGPGGVDENRCVPLCPI